MDKYIKVDDLLDAIYPADPENDGSDGCTAFLLPRNLDSYEVENIVLALPAADVAPVVHGRWETRMIDGEEKACCSGCGQPNKQYKPPYCPHCGAKMDKEKSHGWS